MYSISKTLHLLFVISWMASVFYLPRILVNIAEAAGEPPAVRERLVLMGRRLYRFGHIVFGLAVILGLLLWFGPRFIDSLPAVVVFGTGWLHAKLTLVALLLAHFVIAGRWVKKAAAGGSLMSSRALRWFNEIPVLLLIPVIWLVLAKPF